eukprot:TRINITY_DN1870_c0_g1_i5.p1 TRINITY_DN1870_c0_g1~~TRINITY_DN1870_c0_g1_i5.p1  ORF type:complete len:369 (+),score=27.21 TRINITY_DN1870_c0_g1_i5:126-1232(+)
MSENSFRVHYHIPYVEEVLHHKQHLDVYSPAEPDHTSNQLRPVVVFVHGGGWRRGDKSNNPLWGAARVGRVRVNRLCLAPALLQSAFLQALAKAGYVAVIPSYRLSKVGIAPTLLLALAYSLTLSLAVYTFLLLPLSFLFRFSTSNIVVLLLGSLFVGFSAWLYWLEETGGGARHPQHIEDVAATIKWTIEHIQEYGGDKSSIFLAGHSAGAHLVSLVTLDRRFIREQGVHESKFDECVKGVIGISGVYNLQRLHNFKIIGLPLARWSFVSPAFTPEQYEAASPTSRATVVPQRFLLLIGERDHAPLKDDFAEMITTLSSAGVIVEGREIPQKNHRKIMFDIDTSSDKTTPAILPWLEKMVLASSSAK